MTAQNRLSALTTAFALAGVLVIAHARPAMAQPKSPGDPPTKPEADASASADVDLLYDCPEKRKRGRYVVSLKPETELKDLIDWAMTFHCKSFVFNPSIGGRSAKVTIMTPQKMTANEAWRVFLVALQSMNLTVVPRGKVLEIVEEPQAKSKPLPIYVKGRPANSAQVVRVVLRPQHLAPDDLAAILTELKSKNGQVKSISRAGIIVVTDFGSNVSKMSSLMLAVDQPVVGERLYMIRVKNADATELATKLQEILGVKETKTVASSAPKRKVKRKGKKDDVSGGTSGDAVAVAVPSKIIADGRINALILLASEPAYLRVKRLVERLDVAIDIEGGGRIHVHLLENADAEEMATTLSAVISGIPRPQTGGQRAGARQPARPAPRSTGATTGADAFEGEVRVTHDKPTNSLVVVASVKDFLALREVIRKLDTARPQVYIEATIVEVSVDNGRDLGVSWHGGTTVGDDGHIVLGGVQHDSLKSIDPTTLALATGLLGGALGTPLEGAEEIIGRTIPSFGLLFQALANNSNINILSNPHILTTDNQEAEISVGQNIPYQSVSVGGFGGQQGQAGGFFPGTSIQREDVALTLKITPQINASQKVRLEIDLEISDLASEDFQGNGPAWAKRTIKDTVVVQDQQAVVVGGLMADKESSSEAKVPLLGDIPILGYLFKYSTRRKEKRNLLVVLTPYVVKDHIDLERILQKRVREQREFMRTFSTFRDVTYRPDMDYSRKRGLVEEINRAVKRSEEEAAILRELEERLIGYPDGPLDVSIEEPAEPAPGEGATAEPAEAGEPN